MQVIWGTRTDTHTTQANQLHVEGGEQERINRRTREGKGDTWGRDRAGVDRKSGRTVLCSARAIHGLCCLAGLMETSHSSICSEPKSKTKKNLDNEGIIDKKARQ